MTSLTIQTGTESESKCEIKIKTNCNNDIIQYLKTNKIGNKYAIITDDKVEKLYAKKLKQELKKEKIDSEIFSFPNGERSKTLTTIEKLAEKMIKQGFDRKDAIIALGGGVPGDMAGFLASIYMRGIPFIQIPTTLLAMVDSSVGGKTGIDLGLGKNLLGTFNHANAVFIDTAYLKTLSPKQIKSGLAEVIKYGVIKNKHLFNFLEQNIDKVFTLNPEVLNTIIEQSVKIKAEIVEQDETEQGIRMILNYGHTYGHAIEQMSEYKLLHGYAISIGMIIVNKIAVKEGILKQEDSDRIKKLIKLAGLPITTMQKPTIQDLKKDKKKQGDKIKLILVKKIGEATIVDLNNNLEIK